MFEVLDRSYPIGCVIKSQITRRNKAKNESFRSLKPFSKESIVCFGVRPNPAVGRKRDVSCSPLRFFLYDYYFNYPDPYSSSVAARCGCINFITLIWNERVVFFFNEMQEEEEEEKKSFPGS